MDKKTIIGILLFATTLFCLGVAITQASPILDQSHECFSGDNYFTKYNTNSSHMLAQTFTAGSSGLLSTVEIHNYKGTGSDVDLLFELRDGDQNGTTLASATYPREDAPSVYHWKSFDISSENIWVNSGETYAIVLGGTTSSNGWTWSGGRYEAGSTGYSGGTGLEEISSVWTVIDPPDMENEHVYFTHFDFNFRTYVNTNPIPIPSAVWLLGSGLIGIVGFRRKLRK